jgi:hypothetical protein
MCMGDLKWLVHGIEVPTSKYKDTRKNQMLSPSKGRGMVWETEGISDSTTGLARKGFNAQVELPMTCVWIEVFGKIETKEYDAPAFLIDLVPRCSTDFSFWIRIVPIIWYRIGGTRINYMTSDWGTWGILFWVKVKFILYFYMVWYLLVDRKNTWFSSSWRLEKRKR